MESHSYSDCTMVFNYKPQLSQILVDDKLKNENES